MKRPTPVSMVLILHCLCAVPSLLSAGGELTAAPRRTSADTATTVAHAALYRNFDTITIPQPAAEASDPIVLPALDLPDSMADQRAHAHALLEKVLRDQRFLESLDALSEVELPIGIVKSGGGVDYSILIDRINFTSAGAIMDVYVSLALPQTGSRLAFHGKVPLSAEGGVAGNARVFLLGDHPMKLSSTAMITIKGTDRSYVEFDCGGFLGVNLDAELAFSSDILVPESADGKAVSERLTVNFSTYVQNLNDIVADISIPPFQVKGLPDFGFHVTRASLDWSDLANPEGMAFPEGYTAPLLAAGLPNLWRGIYLQQLEIRLPRAFEKRDTTERVSVGAESMIIDDQGLTGKMELSHVIPDGSMRGWDYTLDLLSLELIANRVTAFGLKGSLSIPMVKTKDGQATRFKYTGYRSVEGNYVFSVQLDDDLKLDMWMADLKLRTGSYITIADKENRFYPSAHLSGEMSLNFIGKGPKATFNSIRFDGMVINSQAPYFVGGTFGFGSAGAQSSLSKYPVVIDGISFKSKSGKAGLAFDVIVNISGKAGDESFSGKGGLVVWGTQDDRTIANAQGEITGVSHSNWRFDKIELTDLKINIRKPNIIELAGAVRFFDGDATYGDGFKGSLTGKIQSIRVEAEALFGRTETFRYWYADALVELKTGAPIVPGVLSAFGFGGGYYSKMKQGTSSGSVTLGRTPSGITYIPDESTVGIRAIVLIGTPRPEVMKGDVALEVSINRHGGINSVTFTGNANFMSAPVVAKSQLKQLASAAVNGNLTEKLDGLARGQVYGSMRLHFDNVNDTFHGNLEIYVNVAGGIVRGVSDNNKAGWAVLHFEKHDWYIHIGTPDQPLGLEVARIFKSKSYFMLGKNLPGSPPPPPQVTEILGNVDLDYMRDMNALASGMGIAFGLHFLVDTGDLRFLMFYGRFSAGTGLDFMLKDYGNQYHCAGSSGPIGINGWYANGQAYAFVMGKIGIKVNLRFYKGTFDILSIGAAAVLQAKGPNPFWMKGTVGGYYKILGGLVKGKCRFDVTVGNECTPVGEQNLLEEVNMIAGITPTAGASDVSVFNAPQVAFNIPVNEVFTVADLEGNRHSFRAVLDAFTLIDDTDRIAGKLTWNDQNDVVAFDASDILPPERKLKARAVLTFEENRNGIWTKVKFSGRAVTETVETTFETGKAPDFIPESNVAVSYPLRGQRSFLPSEYDLGLIQLVDGQSYLFDPGKDWVQRVRITEQSSGKFLEADLAYDIRQRMLTFAIPKGIENGKTYRLDIVNIPRATVAVDQNVETVTQALNAAASAETATLTTRAISGAFDALETRSIYHSSFTTSKYNTFTEKMAQVSLAAPIRYNLGGNVFQLSAGLVGDEAFDVAELSGIRKVITLEAILAGNRWYTRYVYPLVYEDYPLLGWMRVKRPSDGGAGIPPVRDVYIDNLTSAVGSGVAMVSATPFTNEHLVYDVGRSVANDFKHLQRQAVNYVADYPFRITPRLEALLTQPMPFIRYGSYPVKLTYSIPGVDKITSTFELEIFNRIPDNE